ncbi:MAG: carbohydrate-binding domain-containing protein, partial [Prevotella sp.]|nr:carbohydrate-binding domain-containing protein [Prevotella sp.]
MRRTLLSIIALVLAIAAWGQTLKITTSSGTKEYQASQVTANQPATFTGGTTLTVADDVFTISDITNMLVVKSQESAVKANTVNIVYNGSTATVTMADNVSNYVTAEVSGAHVTITQTNTDAIDGDEITYVLSGSTTDGSLTLDGSYKCTVSLAGLTMTNPSGAAINITNKKRIQLSVKEGTESTLTDGTGGSQKA